MTELIPEGTTHLLLVEGREDQEFFIQLGLYLKLADSWPLRIVQFDGKDNLANRLRTLMNLNAFEEIERIGIVRDTDFETNALRSVQDAIRNANRGNTLTLPVPEKIMELAEGPPDVIVLVLPSEDSEGVLEDLIVQVFADDPVLMCTEDFLTCVKKRPVQIVPERVSKVRVRVFVAGKNLSPRPDGDDLEKHRISDIFRMTWPPNDFWENDAFQQAKTFLAQLLN